MPCSSMVPTDQLSDPTRVPGRGDPAAGHRSGRWCQRKTGSAAIVAVHILAAKQDAPVPRGVMNWQVSDAGQLLRDRRCGYGDGGYMLAGRNIRGRDAGDCVIRTDLDTGANLIHDEPSSNVRTDASCSAD